MNFFKLYIGDYQRDTAHLSLAEHGAYFMMLQIHYATGRPLPAGKSLHRMLRAQDDFEKEAIDSVVSQFWNMTDDGLVNARAAKEIERAEDRANTNRRIAKEREGKRKVARTEHESCNETEHDSCSNRNTTIHTLRRTNGSTSCEPNQSQSKPPSHDRESGLTATEVHVDPRTGEIVGARS